VLWNCNDNCNLWRISTRKSKEKAKKFNNGIEEALARV
jgi:hypothetical protein